MTVTETELPGVLIIEPRVFRDGRGYFLESCNLRRLAEAGIRTDFVQDNQSHSCRSTLRGLHFQLRNPQAKLCRVVTGEVMDIIVDVRRGSPTFGRWVKVKLSADDHRQVFIPRGFAHGFSVLSEEADFLYKCDDYYCADDERGILWNDPDLGIDWGVDEPILSAKDRRLPRLCDLGADDLPVYAEVRT